MNDKNQLSHLLNSLMEDHAMSAEKLAIATNVPLRFINSLKNAEFSNLPPAPYIRGYLIKIAGALKADEDEILRVYRESFEASRSGAKDRLPDSHFKKINITKGWLIGFAVVALIGSFAFFRFNEILGLTSLQVEIPATTASEVLALEGSVGPGEQLTLNGEAVYTDEAGHFKKEIMLEPGLNKLEFVVTKFLGRKTTIIKQVYYEPLPEPASTPMPQTTPVSQ